MGNGNSTHFWNMSWLGGGLRLCELFPRLFSLEVDKSCVVSKRVKLEAGSVVLVWEWRRVLFAWEEELLADLMVLLNRCMLDDGNIDSWVWKFLKGGCYTVRDGYTQWMREKFAGYGMLKDWSQLVWNKWAP